MLVLAASTLGVMAGTAIVPVIVLLRTDLRVGSGAAGIAVTVHALAVAAAAPLAGRAIDRWGVRRPFALGLLGYGLAGGAGLVVDSYPWLIFVRVLFGLSLAFVFTGATVALVACWSGALRDRMMGLRGTATMAGGVVFPLLGGALGELSWHAPFALYLVALPLAVIAMVVLPDTRPSIVPPRERAPMSLYLLLFLNNVLLYAIAVLLPQRLGGLGPFAISWYPMALALAGGLAGLLFARVRARFRDVLVLRGCLALWTLAFVVLGVASDPRLLFGGPILFGLGMGIAFPLATSLIGEAVSPAARGRALAGAASASFLGQFAAPVLLAPVVVATSVAAAFIVLAGLLFVTALGWPRRDASFRSTLKL
ncbi:hypothetical protein Lesp02_73990 [Lentzea sp. NBRC 105346]|nr:hypothetical protein Lesp02_73990 [Lentzea sp. NBRC 105346]